MNHNYAIKNHSAERYVLGELTEPEREDYEEHFFDCPQCAEEVKCASEFVQGARQVFARDQREAVPAVPHSSNWGQWINPQIWLQPAFRATCALLVVSGSVIGYQNGVTIPGLKALATAHQVQQTTPAQSLVASLAPPILPRATA